MAGFNKPVAALEVLPDPFGSSVLIPQLKQENPPALIARPPAVDKFPIVIGGNLTAQYLTSTYRLATSGWRYQWVDVFNELIEHDPHARAVCRQRVLSTAGGRIEINAAKLPKNHPQLDLASRIAEDFEYEFSSIPALTQAIGRLNWGVVYGVTGSEIQWELKDKRWGIEELSFIHTRRLNYPYPTSWDLYIYDQGTVGPAMSYMGPTTGVYGLRVADLPGKFILHTPALNADYATRDGEGRYIGTYMLLKRMVVRATAQDFERTIRPWVLGYFNRDHKVEGGGGSPEAPLATKEDIGSLEDALRTLGAGSMNGAALPNSVRVELLRAVSQMSATEFVSFLNREMSKALLGQAFTTEPGANGNLSTSQMAKEGTLEIVRYDAGCLSDTLERDLVRTWMRLNYPGVDRRLCPRIAIRVDELPDPEKIMNIAVKGASIDMPINVDILGEQTGLTLVAADDVNGRRTRMVAAGQAPEPEGNEPDGADHGDGGDDAATAAAGDDKAQDKPNTVPSDDKSKDKSSKSAKPAKTAKTADTTKPSKSGKSDEPTKPDDES